MGSATRVHAAEGEREGGGATRVHAAEAEQGGDQGGRRGWLGCSNVRSWQWSGGKGIGQAVSTRHTCFPARPRVSPCHFDFPWQLAHQSTHTLPYFPPPLSPHPLQTKSVKDLARLSLTNPEYISVHAEAATPTPLKLQQAYMVVPLAAKMDVLWGFLKTHLRCRTIVFLSTCKQVGSSGVGGMEGGGRVERYWRKGLTQSQGPLMPTGFCDLYLYLATAAWGGR